MPGLYVHIPFCKSRCQYCDFFSTTFLERRKEYVTALLQEWQQRHDSPLSTIYFGGGTPSLLDVTDLTTLLSAFTADSQPKEITLEANPGDLTLETLRALRDIGINRLSIGIQSFSDRLLSLIGRRHNAAQALDAVQWAQQAGFANISIDLMYGLPTQTLEDWQHTIDTALSLPIQHVSTYCLTYEEGTPLYQRLTAGEWQQTDDDILNTMYDIVCDRLVAKGFEHYEVSNFALPTMRSRHNMSYWTDVPYIGLGAGAHSYDGTHRRWNISDIDAYLKGVSQGISYSEQETLTTEQKRMERVMLGLRTSEGCHTKDVNAEQCSRLIQQGLLRQEGEHVMATRQGLHILNRIIEQVL